MSEKEKPEKKKRVITDLEDLPGIGPATAAKLKEAGYTDVSVIATASPYELAEVGEFGVEAAKKAVEAAKEGLEANFETADKVFERRKNIGKISTGSKSFDELLGGGIETQCITECYGRFSSGKCIAKNTTVSYLNEDHFYLEPIEETYNKYAAIHGEKPFEKGFVVEGAPVFVYSLTNDGLTKERATHIYKEKVDRIVELKTLRGRELSLTLPHRLLTVTKEGMVWKQAGEIVRGEAIAYPKVVAPSGQNTLDEEDAYFLGFFVAEGTSNPLSIDTADEVLKNWLVQYVEKKFGFAPTVEKREQKIENRKPVFRVLLREGMGVLLKDLRNSNAASKYIPAEIFTASENVRRAFLAGYIEGDGYLGTMVEMTTKSKKLAQDLAYLCTTLGIAVSLTKKNDKKYGEFQRLFVGGESRKIFEGLPYKLKKYKDTGPRTLHGYPKETIGIIKGIYRNSLGGNRGKHRKVFGKFTIKELNETFFGLFTGVSKQRITDQTMCGIIKFFNESVQYLEGLIEESKTVGSDRQKQIELIGKLPFAFVILKDKIGLKKAGIHNYSMRGIPEERAEIILGLIREELEKRVNTLRTGIEQLKIIAYFNWDVVKESTTKDYNDFVYDFVVPNGHTFIGGNIPTLLHNSQLAFQLSINAQKPIEQGGLGGKVLFIDSEGTFRPDRIVQIANGNGMNPDEVLRNIFVARAGDSDHQMILAEKAGELISENNVKLIIVDSLTSHFRADYIGRGALGERQQKLNKHIHVLQKLADQYNIAVYITNQVMDNPGILFGDPTRPIGGHVLAHASGVRVYMRKAKDEKRIARVVDSPNLPEGECVFKVTEKGVGD